MNNIFSFDEQSFNFWPLYEAIKTHYPIGLYWDEDDYTFFRSYPGLETLTNRILDNVHNTRNYRQRWVAFEKQLKTEFAKPIIGTTYGQAPSFSAFVQLENQKRKDLIRSKELHFAVSLVGPFYTIYGVDKTTVLLDDKPVRAYPGEMDIALRHYEALHCVTVSPYQEYEALFLQLEQQLQERYAGYRLIPYRISQMHLEGLRVDYSQPGKATIHDALFDGQCPFDIPMRGDDYYGYHTWRINRPPQPKPTVLFRGDDGAYQLIRRKWKVIKTTKVIEGNLTLSLGSDHLDFSSLEKAEPIPSALPRIEAMEKQKARDTTPFYWEVIHLSQQSLQLGIHVFDGKLVRTDVHVVTLDCLPDE